MKLFSIFILFQIIVILANPINLSNNSRISTYAKLRQEIMEHDVIVHKISPYIYESDGNSSLQYLLYPIDVLDIDEINQFMTVIIYIEMGWQQTNLSWNPSEYLDIDMVEMESKSMWTPHVTVAFGNSNEIQLPYPENVALYFDGTIKTKTSEYLTFRCAITFDNYPFDSQECSFELYFIAYGNTNPTIYAFRWDHNIESNITSFKFAGEWVIQDFRTEMVLDISGQLHPRYIFKVKRRSTYYVITVIFPLILTSSMIPLVFLIPPETGEKISYLVALFTSLAIFLNFISDVMPRSLSSMPYLALLISEVFFQSLCAILATLYVVNRFQEEIDHKKKAKGQYKRQVEPLPKSAHISIIDDEKKGMTSEPNVSHTKRLSSQCSLSCRQIDRIFFLIFYIFQIGFLAFLFFATEWLH